MNENTKEGIADRKCTSFRAEIVRLAVGSVTKQLVEINLYRARFFMIYAMDSGGNVNVHMFLGTGNPGISPTAGMKFKGFFDKVRFTSISASTSNILIIYTDDENFDVDFVIPAVTTFAIPTTLGNY